MSKYQILSNFEDNLIMVENKLKKTGLTNNIELNKLGKKLLGDKFLNVYMANKLPRMKNNEYCIINNKSSKSHGEHWLALVKYGNKKYIWDSFARNYKTLSPYFKNKNWINASVKPFEANDGKDCGQLSLSFILSFEKFKLQLLNVI